MTELAKQALRNPSSLRKRPIFLTGHSRGGALATIFALHYAGLQEDSVKDHGSNIVGTFASHIGTIFGVYTFGSPRVGDREFATQFDAFVGAKNFRFINYSDVVGNELPVPVCPQLTVPFSGGKPLILPMEKCYMHVKTLYFIDKDLQLKTNVSDAELPTGSLSSLRTVQYADGKTLSVPQAKLADHEIVSYVSRLKKIHTENCR